VKLLEIFDGIKEIEKMIMRSKDLTRIYSTSIQIGGDR